LDIIASNISSNPSIHFVLETVLGALQVSTATDSASKISLNLQRKLPQLLSLRDLLPDLLLLEEVVATAVVGSLPSYCDGSRLGGELFEESTMVTVTTRSNIRWSRHLDSLPHNLQFRSFLDQKVWTASTVNILAGLLYRRLIPKDAFLSWLETDHSTRHTAEQLVPVLHAFLDASSCEGNQLMSANIMVWTNQISLLLETITDEDLSPELRSMSSSCVALIISLIPPGLSQYLKKIAEAIQALPVTSLPVELLSIGRQLHSMFPLDAAPLSTALADHGMQWAVRQFAEEDVSFQVVVEELSMPTLSIAYLTIY
jgi:nucleolar pre-ribosomal-associated protein 1